MTHVVINWERVDWCRDNKKDREVGSNEVYRSKTELVKESLVIYIVLKPTGAL